MPCSIQSLLCLAACLVSSGLLYADSSLTSYVNGSDNVVYLGTNLHVYQDTYSGSSWTNTDVTSVSGIPQAMVNSPLASFVQNGVVGIVIVASNQHLVEANYSSGQGWTHADLTLQAGAPLAATNSALSFYLDGAQNFVFQGVNQHIYQIVFNGSWSCVDVTQASSAPAALSGTAIANLVQSTSVGLAYFVPNGHLLESAFSGTASTWSSVDITAVANVPIAGQGSALSIYIDGAQNFVYEASNQHIYEVVYGGSWSYTDVTNASGAPLAEVNSTLTTYVQGSAVGIEFLGLNQNLYEINYTSGNWSYADVTTSSGVPVADAGSASSFYYDGIQHFVFQDPGGSIDLAWFNGSWNRDSPTQDIHAPQAFGGGYLSPGVPLKEFIYYNGQVMAISNPR